MGSRRKIILGPLIVFIVTLVQSINANVPYDIILDENAKRIHQIDCLNILVYVILLILTVCTIWFFKRRRVRFLHETGLAIFYGLIVGAIIRYGGEDYEVEHIRVVPARGYGKNLSFPPDNLYFQMQVSKQSTTGTGTKKENKTYAYAFRGEITDVDNRKLDQKATFDPEIFFNIILPPIIFNAGYSLKRKFFFRNLGTIFTYAFLGTTISCFMVGGVMFAFCQLMPSLEFTFNDCLYFGAMISATDPVTVLAIFHDLHVDVNLYALVFGESILNDAIAIVLAGSIGNYAEMYGKGEDGFQSTAAFKSVGNFVYIFVCSFLIGSGTGCLTAALTKFTRLCDFPLLESSLFVLMSYSTFLMAEAADLTGIVAVLFCGICQAHYTYNNLTVESRARTKQIFELLSFVAENFIFCYIGVSMFTYQKHFWHVGFIVTAFIAIAVGRALNIYPLSLLLNLGRHNKIPLSFQHVLFFSGLRGAMAFALAIRNTLSDQRHLMLTTTSVIAIVTVIVCGGFSTQLLAWLGIPVGVEEDHEMLQFGSLRTTSAVTTPTDLRSPPAVQVSKTPYEKAWLVKKWYNFDMRYMKPLLTHSRPTLLETLPSCCHSIARILTSTQQLSSDDNNKGDDEDSDADLCLDETVPYGDRSNGHPGISTGASTIEGELGLASRLAEIPNSRVRIPGPSGDFV
ncbi:sodium/hydrogen exchanger 6-like isoform X2 [Argiope bruennichi]|uniref:sodium/hydrogen exchanger 6-like isoform X2 n=1 Tax=Argiope bruennichi TaxID=94029 RepID=UPI0024945B51|nr:sodium/hydrogen exchanger 6-like isoform X2 [Argiope bruennichi]